MAIGARLGPSLGNLGEIVVPLQLEHLGGSRLAVIGIVGPVFIAQSHTRSESVMLVQDPVDLGIIEDTVATSDVASGSSPTIAIHGHGVGSSEPGGKIGLVGSAVLVEGDRCASSSRSTVNVHLVARSCRHSWSLGGGWGCAIGVISQSAHGISFATKRYAVARSAREAHLLRSISKVIRKARSIVSSIEKGKMGSSRAGKVGFGQARAATGG